MRKIKIALLLVFSSLQLRAVTVDTVDTYSRAMKKQIRMVVIKPDSYQSMKELPVLYLLHGHGGDYAAWLKLAPGFEKIADQYNFMVICPDGGVNSWYWDAPEAPEIRYETYIINELIPFVDKNYKTIKDRRARAITGLSMGGHGALYLAFRHQDLFGAAGSMSGGVDIRPFPENWEIAQRLGSFATHPDNWEKYTVMNQLHLLTPGAVALMIDCGVSDFFYVVNQNLHARLLERNIPHEYTTRPGGHDWNYWLNAIQYQALFMHNYFRNAKP